jgi:hypothetical protein
MAKGEGGGTTIPQKNAAPRVRLNTEGRCSPQNKKDISSEILVGK